MSEEIFRKKSLEKVKSPESLDDVIRVSNPGVWLLLVSVIVLLLGACVWGIFGHIDSTVPTTVHIEGGTATCTVDESAASLRVGLVVKFADGEAVITGLEKSADGYLCTLSTTASQVDGFYAGTIVIESYKPLSFILN